MESEWGENDKRVEGGWKVGRESDVRLRMMGALGLGHRVRQDFARGRSRWCDGAVACHIPTRHNINMALRHQR